jgi:transposase-like protein
MSLSKKGIRRFTEAEKLEIKRMLETTDMTLHAIGLRIGCNGESIRYQGNRMGIDINARNARINKPRKKPVESVFSRVPESMTGDGLSLEWLSKEW